MDDSAAQVHLTLSLTIDQATLSSGGSVGCTGAVMTFSCEKEGLRCDGEISLRLSLSE